MTKAAVNYIERGSRNVQGWLVPIAVRIIVEFDTLQKAQGIRGPICEIGIHHGKLFILLHLLTQSAEQSVAWDLFERQEENTDPSGRGDRQMFEYNLKRHQCDLGRIKIHVANSLNLTREIILRECEGRPRLFSIDGGHTAEIAFNDLSLAQETLCDGGLIMLDDAFNEAFPGVAEGACRYLSQPAVGLFPVAIVGNKLFLTNLEAAAKMYMQHLDRPREGFWVRRSVAFGKEVVILIPESQKRPVLRNWLGTTKAWRSVRKRGVGRLIRTLLHRGLPPP